MGTEAASVTLEVGAPVVEFTPARFSGDGGSITATRITKIGKRDVVLENGHRYNVERLVKRNGAWDPDTYLLPPDAPQVVAARRANERDRLFSTARTAMEAFTRTRKPIDGRGAVEAIEAFLRVSEADK